MRHGGCLAFFPTMYQIVDYHSALETRFDERGFCESLKNCKRVSKVSHDNSPHREKTLYKTRPPHGRTRHSIAGGRVHPWPALCAIVSVARQQKLSLTNARKCAIIPEDEVKIEY